MATLLADDGDHSAVAEFNEQLKAFKARYIGETIIKKTNRRA